MKACVVDEGTVRDREGWRRRIRGAGPQLRDTKAKEENVFFGF